MRQLQLVSGADLRIYYQAELAAHARRYPGTPPPLSLEQFVARYERCPSVGFELRGAAIGGILLDGDEAHIAVLPQARGLWALLLKPALHWLFLQRTAVLGRVASDNRPAIAFMERNRWRRLHANEHSISYLMRPQGGDRKTGYRTWGHCDAVPATAAAPSGHAAGTGCHDSTPAAESGSLHARPSDGTDAGRYSQPSQPP